MEQITVFNKKIIVAVFKENECFVVYSPYLDLSGYGKTKKEACKSFQIVFSETYNYLK